MGYLLGITVVLLLLVQQALVNAQQWATPLIIDAKTPNIVLEDMPPAGSIARYGVQMDEEIPWAFTLVKINYNGKRL